MRVSVIIPTYNYGKYVRQANESVQRQTWTDWECVVVDDGSTDGTQEIICPIAERDSRIGTCQPK